MKFISGGQRGADIAGLRAGKKLGFETGGWISKGFRTLDEDKPEYAEMYGLVETATYDYPTRTFCNVADSDVTIRLAVNFESPGERCTMRAIGTYFKPHFDIPIGIKPGTNNYCIASWYDDVTFDYWLEYTNPSIINIAGNAIKAIEHCVEDFLVRKFSK